MTTKKQMPKGYKRRQRDKRRDRWKHFLHKFREAKRMTEHYTTYKQRAETLQKERDELKQRIRNLELALQQRTQSWKRAWREHGQMANELHTFTDKVDRAWWRGFRNGVGAVIVLTIILWFLLEFSR